ncbi:MAG: VCBS repeat-containing protein [Deltaproteobacteria bacterium]|nr:VCBS repeat-containing protein [Deltaproteobacteria bacterium]
MRRPDGIWAGLTLALLSAAAVAAEPGAVEAAREIAQALPAPDPLRETRELLEQLYGQPIEVQPGDEGSEGDALPEGVHDREATLDELAKTEAKRGVDKGLAPEPNFTTAALPTVDRSGVSGKTVSLPKGEGTIEGLGESFSAQLSTGGASYSIPFAIPAPRGLIEVSLGLSYSSGSGLGLAGMGMSIGVPFIARQTDRGPPRYDDRGTFHPGQDHFVFNGGQELVPLCDIGPARECAGLVSASAVQTAETLPVWSAGWMLFRPRVEGSFLRFFWSPDRTSWRVQSQDGVTLELGVPCGTNDRSALEENPDPEGPAGSEIYRWWLVRQWDTLGSANPSAGCPAPVNLARYGYERDAEDGGSLYLTDIHHTPPKAGSATAAVATYAHHVRLVYEDRPDRTETYRSGFLLAQSRRLARVDVTSKPATGGVAAARELVRRYRLTYDPGYRTSYLTSVQVEGRCASTGSAQVAEGAGERLPDLLPCSPLSLPAVRLGWSHVEGKLPGGVAASQAIAGFEAFDERVIELASSPRYSLDEQQTALHDVNSDGLPDVLVTAPGFFGGSHGVFWNGGGGKPRSFQAGTIAVSGAVDAGTLTLGNPNVVPLDLDGDGSADLLHMPLVKTYGVYSAVETKGSWRWQGRNVTTADGLSPRIDFGRDASFTRVVDVDFDGLVDVVRSTGTGLETYFSLGRLPGGDGRFGQGSWTSAGEASFSTSPAIRCLPFRGTALSLEDRDTQLADMNGDGIVDLVRLRRGDVHYWPGRGNGYFGTGRREDCGDHEFGQHRDVALEDSPYWSDLQGDSLRVEDVNGDGLSDLVQVRFDEVDVWLNVDGHRFTAPHTLHGTPPSPSYASRVRLSDLDGSGTLDLVFGDAGRYRMIDLAGGTRPGLLVRVENGLGKVTTLEYRSSTAEMLAAAAAGRPWAERAPVVTQVVSRVTVLDPLTVAGRGPAADVTEYTYRDAVFDGRQREFRGFRSTSVHRVGDATAPGDVTESQFLLGECPPDDGDAAGEVCTTLDNPREALKGVPWQVERRSAVGVWHSAERSEYLLRPLYRGLDGRTVGHAVVSTATTLLYDTAVPAAGGSTEAVTLVALQATPDAAPLAVLTGSATLRAPASGFARLRKRTTHDWYGRVPETTDDGCVEGAECQTFPEQSITRRVTHSFRDPAASAWIRRPGQSSTLGAPDHANAWEWQEANSGFDATGLQTNDRRRFHQGVQLKRTQAGAAFAPGEVGTSATWVYVEYFDYDAHGNRTRTYDTVTGQCARVAYDADYAQVPLTETVFTGGCDVGGLATTVLSFDRGLGVATRLREPSGAETSATYDGLGRLTALHRPDPSTGLPAAAPSVTVEYLLPPQTGGPFSIVHSSTEDGPAPGAGGYRESYRFLDGFGRAFVALEEADTHAFVVSGLTVHDAKGQAVAQHLPRFTDSSPGTFDFRSAPAAAPACTPGSIQPVLTTHDAFGRVVSTTDSGGIETLRHVYHALTTESWDAADLSPAAGVPPSPVSETRDGHGRPVRQVETLEGPSGGADARVTTIAYTPLGAPEIIKRTLQSTGATTSRYLVYDRRGRLVLNVEPNSSPSYTLPVRPNGKPNALQANEPRYAGVTAHRYQYDYRDRLVGTSDPRGCGANYTYDRLDRLVSVDLFPCSAATQQAYSAPSPATGTPTSGVELLLEYDQPSASGAPAGFAFGPTAGRLVRIRDRARHDVVGYDARGRVVREASQLVKADTTHPADALASRYDPAWFQRGFTYDAADRPVRTGTGAVTPALLGAGGESWTEAEYSTRGTLSRVRSSYDAATSGNALLTIDGRTADGLVTSVVHGDLTQTQTSTCHDERRRVSAVTTFRSPAASWPTSSPDTVQALLEDLTYEYDLVSNPTSIHDGRDPVEWPAGSKPVTRNYQYDSLHRVRQATSVYPGGSDAWISPHAAENADPAPPGAHPLDDPRRARPLPQVSFPARMTQQTFAYDWLGNQTQTTDDAAGFWDRSLGTITQGTLSSGPYQLRTASGAAGTRSGSLKATYDVAGQLTDLAVDRNGPCVPGGACSHVFRYEWDELGRLTRARRWDFADLNPNSPPATPDSAAAADLRYRYDADDNRTLKTTQPPGQQTRHTAYVFDTLELRRTTYAAATGYVVNALTEVPYLTASGQRLARVHHAPGLTPSTRVFIELGDHLGSTSTTLDKLTGELTEKTTWTPFGSRESDLRPSRFEEFREDYGFTGKEEDVEVGLTYFGKRFLSAPLARWCNPDPLGLHDAGSGDPNLYAYVRGRSLILVDPIGLDGWSAFLDNMYARGEAIVGTPAALKAIVQSDGVSGLGKALAEGAGHLIKDTGEALGDVAYEATHHQGEKSTEKIVSRATDAVLGAADMVSLGAGAAGAARLARGVPNGGTLARAAAADIRETVARARQPRAVAVAVDRTTGAVSRGTSGTTPSLIHPEMARRMPSPSLEKWSPSNCAEFNACNNAMLNGSQIKNLEVHTVQVKSGADFPRCANCQVTTKGATVTSDPTGVSAPPATGAAAASVQETAQANREQ